MVQSRQMELMETLDEEEQAVEPSGLLEDTLKGTAILPSKEVQGAIIPNVAVVVPVIQLDTTMVVEAVEDTFVTSHLIT